MSLKQRILSASIFLWLVIQTVIAFWLKFDIPHFRYQYAKFSWAMYSKPAVHYDLSLFRKTPGGGREPIPDIKDFVLDYQSPEPFSLFDYFRTRPQIEDWHKRLVEAIAREKKDGLVYGASIRWNTKFGPQEPAGWEFETTAEKPL